MIQNDLFKRITVWITLVAVVSVMIFSVIYIFQHADHECTGSDCPVCAMIGQCENNIKNIGTLIVAVVAAFFLRLTIQKSIQCVTTVCPECSLISQKVRMNN